MGTFLQTALGALIGSALTLLATWLSHKMQVKEKRDDEKTLINSFLQGIHDEIHALWERYSNAIGNELEKSEDNSGFAFYYPVAQDYFVFYTANASLLGRVKNSDLRKQIVTLYINAKGLLDSYGHNNEILSKLELAGIAYEKDPSPSQEKKLKNYNDSLIQYSVTLKKEHTGMKELTKKLLKDIKNF